MKNTRGSRRGSLVGGWVALMLVLGGAVFSGQAELRPVPASSEPASGEHAQGPSPAAALPAYPRMGEEAEGPARVLRVESASAVVLMLDGVETRVRLMGVEEPLDAAREDEAAETDQQATRLGELLVGEEVWLERHRGSRSGGAVRTDRDGSAFVYLYRAPDGLMVNLEVVRQGLAKADTRYGFETLPVFRAYQSQAERLRRGVWSPKPAKPETAAPESKPQEEAPPDKHAAPKTPEPKKDATEADAGAKDVEKKPEPKAAAEDTGVWITPSGSKYHRHDCRYAKDGKRVSLEEAKKQGLTPCKVCKPDEAKKSER